MQHDLSKHDHPTVPFEINGKVYRVGALRLKWLCELEEMAMASNIRAALAAIQNSRETMISPGDRARIIAEITARGMSQMDAWTEMYTARGMQFILWKSISENDPSVRLEDIAAMKLTERDIRALISLIHSLSQNSAATPGDGEAEATDPTTPAPSPLTT